MPRSRSASQLKVSMRSKNTAKFSTNKPNTG